MKSQFDQNLLPSFYLWVDDMLMRHGEAYYAANQTFTYADTNDRPANYLSFYSNDRQFVSNLENTPNYVSINGSTVYQNTTGDPKLLIDYDKGRVLVNGVTSSATITGDFLTKEVNVYSTNDSEEDIILNSEFYVSGDSWLETKSNMGQNRYTLPAVFVTRDNSINQPFAFGGMDNTKYRAKIIVMSNSLYEIDAVSSLFRDTARETFKTIPYEAYPYGYYNSLKYHPYTFTGITSISGESTIYVDSVHSYKLSDSAKSKISKDVHIQFLEFDLSCYRMPRSQFN